MLDRKKNVFIGLCKSQFSSVKKESLETSLIVQWLRIHLPIQGTLVQSVVRELRFYMPRGN